MTSRERTEAPRRGRPRDPSVERRAEKAALQIYQEAGLGGVTFDAVSSRSSIGKPALYRRWSSAEELLVTAIAGAAHDAGLRDTGSLREDLLMLAKAIRTQLTDDPGMASLRLLMDAKSKPELFGHVPESGLGSALRAARSIVPRAIARGELPEGTSPSMLIEVLLGGIMLRALTGHLDANGPTAMDDAYLGQLVDLCLSGATNAPTEPPQPIANANRP